MVVYIWSWSLLAAGFISGKSYTKWSYRMIRDARYRKISQISVLTIKNSWLSCMESCLGIAQIRSCMAFQASWMAMKWSAFSTRTKRHMHGMEKTTQWKIRTNKWTACSTRMVCDCMIFIKLSKINKRHRNFVSQNSGSTCLQDGGSASPSLQRSTG